MGKLKTQNLKLKKEWMVVFLLGVAILAVALFLRTFDLLKIPVFVDEAIYVRWAQVMKNETTLRFLPLSDGKQPLFMWSVMPFFKLFADPLIAGRMVSVFSGMGVVVGVFFLTLELFSSKKSALIAAFLCAISPFAVFFSRMALVDMMLTFFGIWGMYFAILAAKNIRLDFAMLSGMALGATWLTKSPAIFFLALLPVTVLLAPWAREKAGNVRTAIKLVGLWIVSFVIAFAMYNIQRLGPNFHLIALRNKDYVFGLHEVLKHPLDPFQFHLIEIGQWFWVLLPGSILIAAVLGVLVSGKKYWRELLFLGVWLAGPLLVQAEIARVFTARYVLFTIPPLFILASLVFMWSRLKGVIMWVAMIVVVMPALWIDYLLLFNPERAPLPKNERAGYLENWTAGTGIREVAQFIKSEHEQDPGTQIVVGTEGYFGTLPDGLQLYVADIPKVVVRGVGISISSVDSSLINAKKAGDKAYLVVNSTRFEGIPENSGLKVLSSYPKAQRPDGRQESLMFFEVTEEAIKIFEVKNAKSN